MLKQNLVLIGNGMAGVRTLEEVLKLDADRFNITVFGEEPYGNYNRIMLSPVLAKEKTIDEIMLNDEQWYVDNGITLHKGKKIETIDRAKQRVIAADGTEVAYEARDLDKHGQKVFQDAGLSADPNLQYFIGLKHDAAGDAAGTIAFTITYIVD